jgi:hypothetical protein
LILISYAKIGYVFIYPQFREEWVNFRKPKTTCMLNQLVRYSCGIVLFLAITLQIDATPVSSPDPTPLSQKISSLKIKDIQKIAGRKLTLKEKIGFLLLKHSVRRHKNSSGGGGATILLGILSLVVLAVAFAVPTLILLSPLFGIAAIVVGSSALKKNPDDKDAKTGRLFGWIAVGIFSVLVIIALVAFATGGLYF